MNYWSTLVPFLLIGLLLVEGKLKKKEKIGERGDHKVPPPSSIVSEAGVKIEGLENAKGGNGAVGADILVGEGGDITLSVHPPVSRSGRQVPGATTPCLPCPSCAEPEDCPPPPGCSDSCPADDWPSGGWHGGGWQGGGGGGTGWRPSTINCYYCNIFIGSSKGGAGGGGWGRHEHQRSFSPCPFSCTTPQQCESSCGKKTCVLRSVGNNQTVGECQ